MAKVWYAVLAGFPSDEIAAEYAGWLRDEHLAEVMRAGAESALQVRMDPAAGGEPPRIMAQYIFPSRADFERYISEEAPRLRAEGLARFGPARGVTFERMVGELS